MRLGCDLLNGINRLKALNITAWGETPGMRLHLILPGLRPGTIIQVWSFRSFGVLVLTLHFIEMAFSMNTGMLAIQKPNKY